MLLGGIGVVVTAAVPASFGFTLVSANTFSPKLLSSIARGDGEVDVLIETRSGDYSSLVDLIEAQGGVITQQYRHIDAIAATLPRAEVLAVAPHPNVGRIYLDEVIAPAAMPPIALTLPDLEGVANPMVLDSAVPLEVDLTAEDLLDLEPANFLNPVVTEATDVWGPADFGSETIIAIIDTGINSGHFLLDDPGKVVGGADFSCDDTFELTDFCQDRWADPDFPEGPLPGHDVITNHFHGSFVASVAAGSGFGAFFATSALVESIELHAEITLPEPVPGIKLVPLFGIAPAAELFIVKVFDHTGGSTPTSFILAGIDFMLESLDELDIDVANLSLGGAILFDGRDLFDQALDAVTDAGITPVVAAGNDGPAPMTVGSPGTANAVVTVAAASHPVNTRVFWDLFFFPFPVIGLGSLLRVSDDIQVIFFSSTGPTGDSDDDRRLFGKPDLTALGFVNLAAFAEGTDFELAFASGTSFATPGVAGGVALLNSFAELNGPFAAATPFDYKQAIINGANPLPNFGSDDQGAGYLNVADAFADLLAQEASGDLGDVQPALATEIDEDVSDIENADDEFEVTVTLAPGLKEDFVFEVDRVESITVSVTDIELGVDLGLNSFELYIQSAKRSTADYFVDSLNVFDDTTVVVTDDSTSVSPGGTFGGVLRSHIVEPGFVKVTIENDHTSFDTLTGTLSVEVEEKDVDDDEDIDGEIVQNEFLGFFAVDVPDGTTMVIIELEWERDWTQYPTTDLDLFVFSIDGFDFSGATLNSPERVVLVAPAGEEIDFLFVAVDGFEVNPFGAEEEFEIRFQFFGGDDDDDDDD